MDPVFNGFVIIKGRGQGGARVGLGTLLSRCAVGEGAYSRVPALLLAMHLEETETCWAEARVSSKMPSMGTNISGR